MATLGDILASAKSAVAISRWLADADPDLAGAIGEAALREGETPESFTRILVAEFTRAADEEAWTTLVSRVRNSHDPGLACLAEMTRWRLSLDRAGAGLQDQG
jgi:hypothetical protein